MPAAVIARTCSNSRALSTGVSDSVGSSSTSTFGSSARALAISTSWRSATLSSLTRAEGSIEAAPTTASFWRAHGPARRSDGRRPRGIAKTMFSATVRSSRIEVLVDDGQPERLRGGGRGLLHQAAADLDVAPVGQGRAGGHRHQRRLARAVLAHEGVDLALDDLEADALERDDAGERLDDVREAENDAGSRHAPYGFPYLPMTAWVSLFDE